MRENSKGNGCQKRAGGRLGGLEQDWRGNHPSRRATMGKVCCLQGPIEMIRRGLCQRMGALICMIQYNYKLTVFIQ